MVNPVAGTIRHGGGSGTETLRVLYVDDDDSETASVRSALEAELSGWEVICRGTAAEARDVLETTAIDCVVSEYGIPDSDGLELLRTVRERDTALPFVLFTDSGGEDVAREAISAGVTEYLEKTPIESQAQELGRHVIAAVTSQKEQSAILDRMTDAFFALDADMRFTYLNARGQRIIRQAAESSSATDELLGRNIWEVVPSAVGTEFYDQYTRAMEEQETASFEAFYAPLETWFDVCAYPSPSGLSVYFRDVTERHEREAQLVERERVLRETYRVIARKDTAFEEKVRRLLEIGQETLGTTFAALSRVEGDNYVFEIVRDPTGEIESGDTIPLGATNCERAITEEQTLVLADIESDAPEMTDRAGYTEMGITCYLGTPVIVDGDVYGTFCFYDTESRDSFSDWEVTLVELMGNWISYEQEREYHERELTRERNRLEDFASVVSHDLRNPLNVASGRLKLIREDYHGDPKHIESARRALDRMDELIDDVLAMARGGHKVVDASVIELADIVNSAWETVGQNGATLDITSEARIEGDRTRLQQLFENLFRNAVEHGSTSSRTQSDDAVEHGSTSNQTGSDDAVEHGSTSPQTASADAVEHGDETVTVRVGPLPARNGFFVEDDGPGIPEEDRESVFERGYTTSADGTGFGLPIVAEIAEAHGGSVTVTESASGGARFEVTDIRVV